MYFSSTLQMFNRYALWSPNHNRLVIGILGIDGLPVFIVRTYHKLHNRDTACGACTGRNISIFVIAAKNEFFGIFRCIVNFR